MKKKSKRNLIVGLIILIVLAGGVFLFTKMNGKEAPSITVLKEIKKYNYKLESNEGKLYEAYFERLVSLLEKEPVDDEEYAKLISILFAIDFYTLNNKITNKDIGGVQFIYEGAQENFQLKASDTIYKYIQSDLYGNRKQILPEVSKVEVEEISQKSIVYKEQKDEKGYEVKLKLSYSKDLEYPTEMTIYLLHDNKKMSIAEIK